MISFSLQGWSRIELTNIKKGYTEKKILKGLQGKDIKTQCMFIDLKKQCIFLDDFETIVCDFNIVNNELISNMEYLDFDISK